MAEIYVYGVISSMDFEGAVSAKSIVEQLDRFKNEQVAMRVNSPGGSVYEADAIYNAISRHGNVIAQVDSLAASAASYIIQAATKVVVAENATLMVHRANFFDLVAGDLAAIDQWYSEVKQVLTIKDDAIASTYAARSGKPKEFWMNQMSKTTYYSAKEAVAVGLATEIGQKLKVTACIPEDKVMAKQLLGDIPDSLKESSCDVSAICWRTRYNNLSRSRLTPSQLR